MSISLAAKWVVVLCLAIGGAALGYRFVAPNLWARNKVEHIVMVFLMASSTIAILTTVGIIL